MLKCLVPECENLGSLPFMDYDNGRTKEYLLCEEHHAVFARELLERYQKYHGITDGARCRVNGLLGK